MRWAEPVCPRAPFPQPWPWTLPLAALLCSCSGPCTVKEPSRTWVHISILDVLLRNKCRQNGSLSHPRHASYPEGGQYDGHNRAASLPSHLLTYHKCINCFSSHKKHEHCACATAAWGQAAFFGVSFIFTHQWDKGGLSTKKDLAARQNKCSASISCLSLQWWSSCKFTSTSSSEKGQLLQGKQKTGSSSMGSRLRLPRESLAN